MHYYQHHLGDYSKDTGHLSVTEHGAYRMLLDHYYSTEAGLPTDLNKLCRIARAMSRAERDAVQRVSAEFFVMREGFLIQKRVEVELAEYRKLKQRNSENGRCGGRPPKNPLGSQSDNSGLSLGSVSETQTKTTCGRVHDPETNLHDPESQEPNNQEPPTPDEASPSPVGKKRKPSSPESSRHRLITDAIGEVYREATGETFAFDKKFVSALKRFLTGWPEEKTANDFLDRYREALQNRENPFGKLCRMACDPAFLCRNWLPVEAEIASLTKVKSANQTEKFW